MIEDLKPLIGKLAKFAKYRMGWTHPPKLFLKQDNENAKSCLGRTAHYDPEEKSITIFVTGRHPKDVLRSLAHELVHHTQNLRGDLSPEKCGGMSDKYAQENPHMRKMEEEAYLVGNMCFRDWEDSEKFSLAESKILKENKTMTKKVTKESLKEMIRTSLTKNLNEGANPAEIKRMPPDQAREVAAAQLGSLGDEGVIALAKAYKTTGAARNEMEANILQKAGTVAGGKGFNDLVQFIADAAHRVRENKTMTKKVTKESLREMIQKVLERKIAETGGEDVETETAVMSSEEEAEAPCPGSESPVPLEGLRTADLISVIRAALEKIDVAADLEEQSRTDRPDRVAGRDAGGRRLDEDEDEELEEIRVGGNAADHDEEDCDDDDCPDHPTSEAKDMDMSTDLDGTPERENNLYEARFNKRNANLFEDLVKKWAK